MMSQAGIVDIEQAHPQIPTMFVTNSGTAIPLANVLEVLGSIVAANGAPLKTTGSGNTITVVTQYTTAAASSVGTNAGLASFNSSEFTVDSNGYVSLSSAPVNITLTGNTGGALSPTAGNFNIVTAYGSPVFAGSGSTLTLSFLQSNFYLGQVPPSSITSGLTNISITCTGTGMNAITSGNNNIGIGGSAGARITSGTSNIFLGSNTGSAVTTGTQNTAIGTGCFSGTGSYNTIYGASAASSTPSSASYNTGIGYQAIASITSGANNTTVGAFSLSSQTIANNNVAIGYYAGNSITSGGSNTIVGFQAGMSLSSGIQNALLGSNSGFSLTSGTNNTILGNSSGNYITTGSNNVIIGTAGASYSSSESNNICIGYQVQGTVGESNVCRIGSNSITNTYLQGIVSLPQGQVVNVTAPGSYPYTVLSTDYLISANTSSSAITITLPSSPVTGEVHIVKDASANAATNNITVSGNGNNIVGTTSASTQVVSLNGASVTYIYNGSVWLAT
jgi:hypothetical protein